jgi:hypothetical protein
MTEQMKVLREEIKACREPRRTETGTGREKTEVCLERKAPTSDKSAQVAAHNADFDGAIRKEPIGALEDRYGTGI